MLYPPVEALQTLSRFQRLEPGDLVLTGTPAGTALTTGGKIHGDWTGPSSPPSRTTRTSSPTATSSRPPSAPTTERIDLGGQRNTVRDAR